MTLRQPLPYQNTAHMKTPSRKIMIIEDDQPLFHSLSFTLTRHEYTVDLASNGLEALDNLIVMQRSMDPYSMLLNNCDAVEKCRMTMG